MPGAIVVEQRDGWFKIRLGAPKPGESERSAWVKASLAARFMPLSELFEEFMGVTVINQSFTGRLSSGAGSTSGPIMPRVSPGQSVRVIEIRGQWIQVELLSNSPCTAADDGPPEVVATGWLPLRLSRLRSLCASAPLRPAVAASASVWYQRRTNDSHPHSR